MGIKLNRFFTEPIDAFLKYVIKLKYDEKPDYEKCRKYFSDDLKALVKTNNGELEFKMSSSTGGAVKKTAAENVNPLKGQRQKAGRPSAKAAAAPKATDNTENITRANKRKRENANQIGMEDKKVCRFETIW